MHVRKENHVYHVHTYTSRGALVCIRLPSILAMPRHMTEAALSWCNLILGLSNCPFHRGLWDAAIVVAKGGGIEHRRGRRAHQWRSTA